MTRLPGGSDSAEQRLFLRSGDAEHAMAEVRTILSRRLEQMNKAVAPSIAASSDEAQIRALLDQATRDVLLATARELDIRAADLLAQAPDAERSDILDRARAAASVYTAAADGLRADAMRLPEAN